MGRPRVFDMAVAIKKSQDMFWKEGFDAVSLAALASAIGVHKPSLYAAFGDKRDLYLAAYEAYQKKAADLVRSALGLAHFREAIGAFFASDLDLFLPQGGRGCFMLETAVPLTLGNEEMRSLVCGALDGLQRLVALRVDQARMDGELSEAVDAATATDLIISTHIALSSRARSGASRAALQSIAKRVLNLICRC